MNENELDIRVLATIRTDLALKIRALREISNGCDEDYVLSNAVASAAAGLRCAVNDLNRAIDEYNRLIGKT